MMLSNHNLMTLYTFALAQSAWHRGVAAETGKILRMQSVTQPNSRSTVELHDYAARELAKAAAWASMSGAR